MHDSTLHCSSTWVFCLYRFHSWALVEGLPFLLCYRKAGRAQPASCLVCEDRDTVILLPQSDTFWNNPTIVISHAAILARACLCHAWQCSYECIADDGWDCSHVSSALCPLWGSSGSPKLCGFSKSCLCSMS